MPHKTRPDHLARHPEHVTLRARPGLPSFRGERAFCFLLTAISRASRDVFRIIAFSVQSNHIHLLVEADDRTALIRGVQGLAIRCARAFNRAVHRRGSVWADRYHSRPATTPREVRAGYVYVLQNHRKHEGSGPGIDGRSSGPWFDGWKQAPPRPVGPFPVCQAKTWLASVGWRLAGGPIRWTEAPAPSPDVQRRATRQS